MIHIRSTFFAVTLFSSSILAPAIANAGTDLGAFCWNLEPFDDVICLDVEAHAVSFALSGIDASELAELSVPVFGTAAFDEFSPGTILVSLDLLGIPFLGVLSSSSLSGTWTDGEGDSGDLVFLGSVESVSAAAALSRAQTATTSLRRKSLDRAINMKPMPATRE